MSHAPTPEQQRIIDAARTSRGSMMISAYAGTAKTTTLEMLSAALPPGTNALALAFNVKIKQELEKRLPPSFTVKTMNGLGHSALGRGLGKRLTLNTGKLGDLVTAELKRSTNRKTFADASLWNNIRQLVEAARNVGLVPSPYQQRGLQPDEDAVWDELADDLDITPSPELREQARAVLRESIAQGLAGVIDFTDQIYLSTLFSGAFERFPLVLVDEAQDLSPLQHLMLRKVAADQLIVCGDPRQAIYAFRGADARSMERLRALRPAWQDFALTLTFRCPSAIVARQQDHAPGYTAAPSCARGSVVDWREQPWHAEMPPEGSAILCRNNGPIVGLAMKLIKAGVPCHILGRDLGKGLVSLLKKLCPTPATPKPDILAALSLWQERETAAAIAEKREWKLERINDRADCIRAVAENCVDRETLISAINDLFSRERGRVTLSTGHRSKGLEWETVIHLDPWRVPSRFAKTEAAISQENNLRYVIETRTKNTLILANLEDFTA